MAHDYDRQSVKASVTGDDGRVFSETLVAVKLHEVFKQALDQIERVRAIRVTRKLHALESRPLLAGRGDRLCFFFVFAFGHF
jgi:hypothetical protein